MFPCGEYPPPGIPPNLNFEQWNTVLTGVVLHCWGCRLDECMIFITRKIVNWNVVAIGGIYHSFSLWTQSNPVNLVYITNSPWSDKTSVEQHIRLQVKRQTQGFKPYRVFDWQGKQTNISCFFSCIICTLHTAFGVSVTVPTNTAYVPTMVVA